MKSHVTLDLSEEQLLHLGMRFTAKRTRATRKQVVEWVQKLVADDLAERHAKTELRPMLCPKCNKPISVPVPVMPKAENTAAKAPQLPAVAVSAHKALQTATAAAAKAMDEAAAKLRELAATCQTGA